MPPLLEFTDSLLIGLGSDVDLDSFKMVDLASGRLLAIRPDITPQTARIDAHSLARSGPVRLCYAGSVAHTRPRSLQATRIPVQVGAELYGEASLTADIEVISLMLETLAMAGLEELCLDLGHVGIYRQMIAQSGIGEQAQSDLFTALQSKARADIVAAVQKAELGDDWVERFVALNGCHGGIEVLDRIEQLFFTVPAEVTEAVSCLRQVASTMMEKFGGTVSCYFDLAELRGYHYHTGLVFAALAPGFGQALANGGRYDDIGKVFGRPRPATGFSLELKALAKLATNVEPAGDKIFAPYSEQAGQYQAVSEQRQQGHIVVCGMPGQLVPDDVDQVLTWAEDTWQLSRVPK
jgi:ATP phosphoribosyltransferase regulatory subunit